MSISLKRLTASDIKAALATINKDPALSSNGKAVARMRMAFGEDRLSRRCFIEACLSIEQRQSGEFGAWKLNGSQRYVESVRQRTVRTGKLERYAVLKARKRGISTLFLGYALERICRVPHYKSAIVADIKDSARALLQAGKLMRENLPIKLAAKFSNVNELYYDSPLNSSLIISTALADEPLRGRTLRGVHCTEPQLWEDALKKRAAIELCVASQPGTIISYEGTGAGRNWWYDFWWAAQRGESEFTAIFLSWLRDRTWDAHVEVRPEECEQLAASMSVKEQKLRVLGATWRQLLWRRQQISSRFGGNINNPQSWITAEKYFAQEFPATPEEAFLSEGRPAFIASNVDRAIEGCRRAVWQGDVAIGEVKADEEPGFDYTLLEDVEGALKIWEQPIPGREYVAGVDAGNGIGDDNSVVDVLDLASGKQVAVWCANNVEPRPFGKIATAIGQLYRNACVLVEIEGPGRATLDAMKEARYPNLGSREIWDTRHTHVVTTKLGWSTNTTTRDLMFNELREEIGSEECGIVDRELCREMLAMYRDEKDKEQTPTGSNDDRVIAHAVALMCRRQDRRPKNDEVEPYLEPGSLEERHWTQYRREVKARERALRGEPEEEDEIEWI